MNREDLLSLCERFVSRRGLVMGRVSIDPAAPAVDPVPEIIRSFRLAEISESEKNALVAYVRCADPRDGDDDEMVPDVAEATLVELDDPVG